MPVLRTNVTTNIGTARRIHDAITGSGGVPVVINTIAVPARGGGTLVGGERTIDAAGIVLN